MEIQKAGNNSVQIQAGNITLGITEERARAICDEKFELAKKEFTQEAHRVAYERIKKFEEILIPKVHAIDEHYRMFSDPEFQLMLVSAQRTAATTDRPADYELLADLLAHRVENGSERHVVAGIRKAIEVVNDLTDEALLGLTVFYSVDRFSPASPDIITGINILDDMYGKLIYGNLPAGHQWIEHLDMLNALRISRSERFCNARELYTRLIDGYAVTGIEKDSQYYKKAIIKISENKLPSSVLVDHALNEGYVRVNIVSKRYINSLIQVVNGKEVILNESQKDAVNSLFELYSVDSKLKKKVIDSLMEQLEKRVNIKKIIEWYNGLPLAFRFTPIGNVIAHVNSRGYYEKIPPFCLSHV